MPENSSKPVLFQCQATILLSSGQYYTTLNSVVVYWNAETLPKPFQTLRQYVARNLDILHGPASPLDWLSLQGNHLMVDFSALTNPYLQNILRLSIYCHNISAGLHKEPRHDQIVIK